MAIIIKVTITDDSTGQVVNSFVDTIDDDQWGAARSIKRLLNRVFMIVFGQDDEWR